MTGRWEVTNMDDLVKAAYSPQGHALLSQDSTISPFITKDAPVLSSTAGFLNRVYGRDLFLAINMEANTVGALPTYPWLHSGLRVVTTRGIGSGTLPSNGVTSGGAIPATTKPTLLDLPLYVRTVSVAFDNSTIQEYLARNKDDAVGAMSELRDYHASEHREDLNAMLNVQNGQVAYDGATYYRMESVDRICGSYAEVTNCQESDESSSYTTGDLDLYGSATDADYDRDANSHSWNDAYVNYNTADTTVRTLTDTLVESVISNTDTNGANSEGQVWQTKADCKSKINQLYEPQVRYNILGHASAKISVNGISTGQGIGYKTNVMTLSERPLYTTHNNVADTGGVGRLYLFDTSNPDGKDRPRLGLSVAIPTQYWEAGTNNNQIFAVNKFGNEGVFATFGDLVCRFFPAQGKLRDLK